MEEKTYIQITLEGDYSKAFQSFQENHPMDGRTNRSAFLEMIRQTAEYKELKGENGLAGQG